MGGRRRLGVSTEYKTINLEFNIDFNKCGSPEPLKKVKCKLELLGNIHRVFDNGHLFM